MSEIADDISCSSSSSEKQDIEEQLYVIRNLDTGEAFDLRHLLEQNNGEKNPENEDLITDGDFHKRPIIPMNEVLNDDDNDAMDRKLVRPGDLGDVSKAWDDYWIERRARQQKLWNAAEKGDIETLDDLLQGPDVLADLNTGGLDDWTALHWASHVGSAECCAMLISRGSNVSAVSSCGVTPLHLAAKLGRVSVVGLLLRHKAPVNIQDFSGNTPLHEAAHNGHETCVRMLVSDGGSSIRIRNNLGQTANANCLDRATSDAIRDEVRKRVMARKQKRLGGALMIDDSFAAPAILQQQQQQERALASAGSCAPPAYGSTIFMDGYQSYGVFDDNSPSNVHCNGGDAGGDTVAENGGEEDALIRMMADLEDIESGAGERDYIRTRFHNVLIHNSRQDAVRRILHSTSIRPQNPSSISMRVLKLDSAANSNAHDGCDDSPPQDSAASYDLHHHHIVLENNNQHTSNNNINITLQNDSNEIPSSPTNSNRQAYSSSPPPHHTVDDPTHQQQQQQQQVVVTGTTPNGRSRPLLTPPPLNGPCSQASSGLQAISTLTTPLPRNATFGKNSSASRPLVSLKTEMPTLSGPNLYTVKSLLGQGSFGEVYKVSLKSDPSKVYALKVLRKEKIFGRSLQRYAMTERNVLTYAKHPFIVSLKHAFQTTDHLGLVLEFCPGGNLQQLIARCRRLKEAVARLYIAEVLLALEFLHHRKVIYRDLKPENIVLDAQGHAKLTDFGLSKEGQQLGLHRSNSFCGSVAYLAPEMLTRQGHDAAVDIYGLGVLLFEMLVGLPPFYAPEKSQIYRNIQSGQLRIPPHVSKHAASLIYALLDKDPSKRIGVRDPSEIKRHLFFAGLDFQALLRKDFPILPLSMNPSVQDALAAGFKEASVSLAPLLKKKEVERLAAIDGGGEAGTAAEKEQQVALGRNVLDWSFIALD